MKPTPRTVYIAEGYKSRSFDVSFNCPVYEFPWWHHSPARTYKNISRSSLARLNHLVFLPLVPVTVSAHLVPYICLWVIFPPKGSRS